MALVHKQDSNFTGLSYAVEISPGVVDGTVTWYPLEPNSYKTFGGDVKTKQRMPINASRQLKKGVVVDLDAQGGFVQDLTADNFQDTAQCFLYANLRKKSELAVSTVSGSLNAYAPAAGGEAYLYGDLLFAKNFPIAANNGLKFVVGDSADNKVYVDDTALENDTTGIISRVGYEFGAGDLTVDVSGTYPKLVVASVAAHSTLTSNDTTPTAGDTVTIGDKVYTFVSPIGVTEGNVLLGASATASLTNLFNAINHGTGSGTTYVAAAANAYVSATNPTADTVVLTALFSGDVGNHVVTTTTNAGPTLSWPGGTLNSGTPGTGGRGLNTFGIIPGEFIYVGGDAAGTKFSIAPGNNGFARVRSVHAAYLELDKTQHTMLIDAGTSQTVRIFFGRVLKNESDPTLIVKRSLQIERTLGAPDDAQPTQIQSEYLVRALANQLKIDMKTADIVRMELDFLANNNELRTGAVGVKAGTRAALVDTDAFNTTSDVAFTKMAIVTSGNACPTALFGYFTDLAIDVKNNLKQNKAVSVLGAFDSSPGFFQVSATVTAYFTDVAEMQAVIDNDSVTVETHLVKFNKGITIDLPLIVMSKAIADVKLNEPIMIPLASDAATAKLIDPALDYTMLWVFWDYLPTVAG